MCGRPGGPCVGDFPDLVDLHRQFRKRDFEVISVAMDLPGKQSTVQKFLNGQHASITNYQYHDTDRYKLLKHLEGKYWEGALPYTMLVEPGGKVIYRIEGEFDLGILKKKIVEYVGRTYID